MPPAPAVRLTDITRAPDAPGGVTRQRARPVHCGPKARRDLGSGEPPHHVAVTAEDPAGGPARGAAGIRTSRPRLALRRPLTGVLYAEGAARDLGS
ncbi:hypothetical protein, partial [Streptomyces sp. DI166]|uniref:hypothetical protein n=1 Tax=Streptomyces sp. DI166 TaxID=1839783 RepID=UPI001C401066